MEQDSQTPQPRKARASKAKAEVKFGLREQAALDKETATKNGEPWVSILNIELDPENIGNGAIELDWNDIFLARLVKAGYQGKTDVDIVDRWFTDLCRNVAMENYEQWDANYATQRRVERQDLGGGKSSVS